MELPDELWLELAAHLDQQVAVRVLPFVSRHLWQLLRKPSKIWRSIKLVSLVSPPLSEAAVLDGIRSTTALCAWVRARGAAVEALNVTGVAFAPACVLLVGLLGGALPALTHFELNGSGWERGVPTAPNLSWLLAELGKCRSLRRLVLSLDFPAGQGSADQWAALRQLELTSLELSHSGLYEEYEAVPVPAGVSGLPCLHSLSLRGLSDLCFEGSACQSTLQSLHLLCCWPAERGFALQALPALTSLMLKGSELYVNEYDEETQDCFTSVRSSLQLLMLGKVNRFPAWFAGLSNLENLHLHFTGTLHVPPELRACAKLTALQFTGEEDGDNVEDQRVHIKQLDLRGFPCLQELRFEDGRLFCNRLLVHAAHLPLLGLVKFEQAFPASGVSAKAVRELGLALQGLGKHGVLCLEPA